MHNVHYIVAGNPHTPDHVLLKLAVYRDERVRRRVAENVAADVMLLKIMMRDPSSEVRSAVAGNPRLPPEHLLAMTRDTSPDVRLSIAENLDAPLLVLLVLGNDENPFISAQARDTVQKIRCGPPPSH